MNLKPFFKIFILLPLVFLLLSCEKRVEYIIQPDNIEQPDQTPLYTTLFTIEEKHWDSMIEDGKTIYYYQIDLPEITKEIVEGKGIISVSIQSEELEFRDLPYTFYYNKGIDNFSSLHGYDETKNKGYVRILFNNSNNEAPGTETFKISTISKL